MPRISAGFLSLLIVSSIASAEQAASVPCRQNTGFEAWVNGVLQEAIKAGVSQNTAVRARPQMIDNPKILQDDHAQGVLQQTFLQFSDRMANQNRIRTGIALWWKHKGLFDDIYNRFGVPAPVLLSYWALESDFRTDDVGNIPVLQSVTTLAYDCRRPEFFREQLIAALRIVDIGYMDFDDLVGDWAGELGGMQFTPSNYLQFGVDFHGGGQPDIINSVDDMLASAANFLQHLGWQKGQPWLQEVRVPATFPWQKADLSIRLPRSQWVQLGIRPTSGSLPADGFQASLVLPMGHLGPAFLVYDNFTKAYLGWNASLIYSTTAAYLATRIAGAPPVSRGTGVVYALDSRQLLRLQQLLQARGLLSADSVDGKLGASTRKAVQQLQLQLGLPADSFPTIELLNFLNQQYQ